MSVTESINSGRQRYEYGYREYEYIAHATWADIALGNVDVPRIGYILPADPELVCTSVVITPVENNNTHCKIEALFSNSYAFCVQPDTSESWRINLRMRVDTAECETYVDTSDNTVKLWEATWVDAGGTNTLDNAPTLRRPYPQYELQLVAYGSEALTYKVFQYKGYVNSTPFLPYLSNVFTERNRKKITTQSGQTNRVTTTIYKDDISLTLDDTGYWMFSGLEMDYYNAGWYKYVFTFSTPSEPFKWNQPFGVTANVYKTMDFKALLSGFQAQDPDFDLKYNNTIRSGA